MAPTSATAIREPPALNVAPSQLTHSRGSFVLRLERRIEADVLGRPGLGRAAPRRCCWRTRTSAPAQDPPIGRTSSRCARSTAGKISVEARRITSRDIHCKATTPAGLTARTVPALWSSPLGQFCSRVEAPSAEHRDPAESRRYSDLRSITAISFGGVGSLAKGADQAL